MDAPSTTHTFTVISALAIATLGAANIKAETTGDTKGLFYSNRAYVHAIADAPNPVADRPIENAEIVYVDKAYGQAIYGYPSAAKNTVTAFNVEYVDRAYGQAIYSYPNNNPRHRLDLVDNASNPAGSHIVQVVLKLGKVPANPTGTGH
jgi:hypothetical protein